MNEIEWGKLGVEYSIRQYGDSPRLIEATVAFAYMTALEAELAKWKPQPKFKVGQYVHIENINCPCMVVSIAFSEAHKEYRYKLTHGGAILSDERRDIDLSTLTPMEKGDA